MGVPVASSFSFVSSAVASSILTGGSPMGVWNCLEDIAVALDPVAAAGRYADLLVQEEMLKRLAAQKARVDQIAGQLCDDEDYEEEEGHQQQQDPRLGHQQRPALTSGSGQQQGGGVVIPPRRGKGR